ncbi:MAG: glycosyltransferase, partial [Polyangia bacterium]
MRAKRDATKRVARLRPIDSWKRPAFARHIGCSSPTRSWSHRLRLSEGWAACVAAREIEHFMNRTALVMIVRDEARCIERCLASARPWVDELRVLDTGSTDATIDIAQRLGARVDSYRWNDDFAAARNAALALVDADWCL